jgi:hypothetical protein
MEKDNYVSINSKQIGVMTTFIGKFMRMGDIENFLCTHRTTKEDGVCVKKKYTRLLTLDDGEFTN